MAPLKLLVLGHSDSDGTKLSDPGDSWPRIVERELWNSDGLAITLTHKVLFAGGNAIGFLERQLDGLKPDIVVVAPSSYGATFEAVSNRIEELLGKRAAALTRRIEAKAAWSPGSSARGYRLSEGPKRTLRRLIGGRTAISAPALIASYREIFQRLAREEDVQLIGLGGAGYTAYHERNYPRMREIVDLFAAELAAAAREHHIDWLVHEDLMGGPGVKEAFYMPDGVHTNEAAQRLVAEAMLPIIQGRWSGR